MRYLFLLCLIIETYNSFVYMNTYNYRELITKAKLCKISYSKNPIFNITRNQLLKKYDNYIFINETKSKSLCYIFYNKNQIDICFKGTTGINDMCTNINIYPVKYLNDDIRIHKGFLTKYLLLKPIIISNIDKIIDNNNNINELCFNGHSLGGAIANIASLDMRQIYKDKIIKCITFGSPRVGNNYFTNEYNKNINESFRIINKNDLIQYLPLKIIYNDIHNPIILEEYKKISIYDFFLNIYGFYKYHHHIKTYIKNLKSNCN